MPYIGRRGIDELGDENWGRMIFRFSQINNLPTNYMQSPASWHNDPSLSVRVVKH
jgi:hypothetical protein